MLLDTDYDPQADCFYLSLGKPRPAVGEVDDAGLLLRYALADGAPCGVTVVRFRDWSEELPALAGRIATFLSCPIPDVLSALNAREEKEMRYA